MKTLVVYCHPDPNSFNAAVLDVVVGKLHGASSEVQIIDLYRSGFDPVLSRDDLERYLDVENNANLVRSHVDAISWCDSLIFVYPTWWYGLPAMLKGWLDRTMLPGKAFHMGEDGKGPFKPGLRHITRFAVFTTCGASWLWTLAVGAPGKRTLMRALRAGCAIRARTRFVAHYLMDSSTPETRARHLARVGRAMDQLVA